MRWERVQQQRGEEEGEINGISGPGKRWGHTCNAIKGGKFLYVFGGYGRDNRQTNQVHVFDTVKQIWSEPILKGIVPTARDSHSCTNVGDNLFVFGGTDGMMPLQDLHILDTSSHTWICPSVRGDGPEAREGHSAALVGRRLFIFGGCGKAPNSSTEVYYNDLHILNTETFVWKRATTSGTPPPARDSHTCSSWKNKIIVIGGEDAHDYYLSDVHILDTDTLVWKELNTYGQLLPPRAGHSTVSFGKDLFVFGGFTDAQNLYDDLHMLDVETGLWTKVTAIGDGPSARFSVAGDNLDPAKGGVLVFVGGCSRQLEALDDMYYLYTELTSENGRDEQRTEQLSLRKQLKLKCQAQYLVPAVHNKALVAIGTNIDLCQSMPVTVHGQPSAQNFSFGESQSLQGKRSFQAKVTQSFPLGYAIETTIDGKSLRGILFSNRPGAFHAINNSNRKRPASEVSGANEYSDQNGKLRTRSLEQNKIDHGQTDGVQGSQSELSETQGAQPESAAVTFSTTQAPSDVAQAEKGDLENPGPSVAPISNSGDEKTDDVPKCQGQLEIPVPSLAPTLNSEDDKMVDVSKSSPKVSEENAFSEEKDHLSLPLNQDERKPMAEELNHPTNSI